MNPVSLSAVEYLTLNMRAIDQVEIYGLRAHDSPLLLAREVVLAASYGKAGVAMHNGRPCGIVGVTPLWPGVWTIWSFGTVDWARGVIAMSRFGKRVLQPFILARGAHRLQCESRFDHFEAHRWLGAMGAKADGLLQGYGRDGSDYIMFSWRRSDVLQGAEDSRAEEGAAAA